jgi:hypothetical protein
MEQKAVIVSLDEKEVLQSFLDYPELRRQRILFNPSFGNPLWFVAVRSNGKASDLRIHPQCAGIWSDPRLESWACRREVLRKIAAHFKEPTPFSVRCRHGLASTCIPLDVGSKRAGVLCLAHIRPALLKSRALELLTSTIRNLLSNVVTQAELRRLYDSVRPRAIALSTVHTVHRIINSTLNLDELVDRLAHLTAQVLRAERCSIFLNDPARAPRSLVERARAGFPKASRPRSLRAGEGNEGRVFATAKNILRKNTVVVPLIDEDVIGVISLSHKREGLAFDNFDHEILTTLAEEAVIAIKNAQLYEEQKRVTLGAIQSLAAVLGARFAHTRKLPQDTMLKIALGMGDELKLSEEEKQAIHYAALLKDAGKIGLPDEILRKPTKLTGEEYQLMRQHPVKGALIVQSFESLKPVAPIILYAHEHYDGSGYPHGLKGEEIPVGARILAVVNAFDALVAGRPYKTRATLKEALEELKSHKGTQFDPRMIEAFEAVIAKPAIHRLLSGLS